MNIDEFGDRAALAGAGGDAAIMSGFAPAPQRSEAAVTALIVRKLMPLLVVSYIIAFLDRTNIALAKTYLQADLGLSAAAFGLGAGLFFLTYALFEVPSNLIMHRVGARLWITRIMVSWGLISMAMAYVQGPNSFYAARMLLGITEAGFYPGVMLYLTYWFGAEQRARATGLFLLGVCIANVIGGPLGGLILGLDGKLGFHGWQWLFILEAAPAVLMAVVIWLKLPDRPSKAKWLTAEEAAAVERRIKGDEAADTGESMAHALLGPQSLLTIGVYLCHQISAYTVTFFLPGIIGGWGALSPVEIGLLNSLPWLAATAGAIFALRSTLDATNTKRLLIFGLLVMSVGLLIGSASQPVLALIGFCIAASMFFVVQALVYTYPQSRLSGARLAAGLAFTNCCGVFGGFAGPTVMGIIEQTTGSTHNGLLAMAALLVVAAILAVWLRQGAPRRAD
jgi:MFS family permease